VKLLILAAGITSMTAALDRGDIDEAARQGALAGPAIVERALAARARSTRLAAIAAAPLTEDRAELLPALAEVAAGPDRRTAIPAARAARVIATELTAHDLPDDLATEDIAISRARYESIARNTDHFVEVRLAALDTAQALGGFDLPMLLGDPDPLLRAEAIDLVPRPVEASLRAPLAQTVAADADPKVALAAARLLCADDPAAGIAALGTVGVARLAKLPRDRDAARCLR
jgi:hypothetical protein